MTQSKPRLYLHIGTHKTGSTSFQYFLRDQRAALLKANKAFFDGAYETENHLELHVAAMQQDRGSFSKVKYGITGTSQFRSETKARLLEFYAQHEGKDIILSAEGLTLLRYADELSALREIVSADRFEVFIILVLRNAEEYLASLKAQIIKVPGREPSADKDSHLYIEADSWLADYKALKQRWRDAFGQEALRIIDYDAAVKRDDGNIIPSLMDEIDVAGPLKSQSASYRLNRNTKGAKIRRWLAKFKPF